MEIVDYLQGKGRHSVDVLLAIYDLSASGNVSWKDVKQWFKERGKNVSDGTFRARREELVELGLAEKTEGADQLKFGVKLTGTGVETARVIKQTLEKLNALENAETQK